MTPSERAQAVCNGMFTGHADLYRPDIEAAIAASVAAEREACARAALDENSFMMLQDFGMQSMCDQVRENVAAVIRARQNSK